MSRHMNIVRAINGDSMGFVFIIRRSVVSGDPLLLSGTIVLDRGVIKTRVVTESRYVDIPGAVDGYGIGIVIGIRGSVIAGDPLFCARGVVLDRRVIVTGA